MDCSDDSFAWTDASSDSSIMTSELEQNDLDESGLDYKKKIQEELFNDEPTTSKSKKKKRKASEMLDSNPVNNKKNIKTEPESDMDAPKKKKKRKNTESENGFEFSKDTLQAEDYLNLRVKQEQLSFAEPEPLKKKKKKKKHKKEESEFETLDSESTETLTVENESEMNGTDDKLLNNFDYNNTIVEIDKFDAGETIIQKKKKKSKKEPKSNTIAVEETQTNLSKNLSIDNLSNTDNPIITTETVESDSDFEPSQKHIKPSPEIKTVKKKMSKKSEKKSLKMSTSITDRLTFEDEESMDSEKMDITVSKEFETQDAESIETLTVENESEMNGTDKNLLNNYDCNNTIVKIDKFEAGETIIQKKKKKSEKEPKTNTIAVEKTQTNSSKNLSSDNLNNTDNTIITNGTVESDSDFEPRQNNVKPSPEIKMLKKKMSKKSEKESLKMSTSTTDRHTFEDEKSMDSEKMDRTVSKELQKFVNMNTKLKVCAPNIQKDNIITDDDEVWIFRIPKEVHINDLKDLNFILDTKWKIKIRGQSYDGVIENHSSHVPLLCYDQNKCQIKNMPIMGDVSLRKRIPKAHIPQETCMINNQTNFIPLPETKCRHPLFGVEYKKAIKIPRAIAERLNVHIDNDTLTESFSGKKEKKKKHKKEKKKIEKDSEPEVDIEVLQSPNPKKKKRKRKHSDATEDTNKTKSKKSKCVNLEPDSAEAWESERAIEANLFNF